jgi:hypothetical protein
MSNPATYQLPATHDPPSDPFNGTEEDGLHEDEVYTCPCGCTVPYVEATERMRDYGNCEDCDSSMFD